MLALLEVGGWPVSAAAARPADGEVGTFETLAGPGFCGGPARVDPTSETVRALAVDASGAVHFDTGPPEDGLVGQVDARGQASLLRTGIAQPLNLAADGGEASLNQSMPGRLAGDAKGGVFIAAGARVIHVDSGGVSLETVAGDAAADPAAPPGVASGDGGPAIEARFASIRSLASDEAGNLYVADEVDAGSGSVRIRFVNRGSQPATVYPGTPQELTVAPGTVETIAGGPGPAGAADGGPARVASLAGAPPALAVAANRLYVASSAPGPGSSRPRVGVRMINLGGDAIDAHGVTVAGGAIETVAGGGPAGYGGDGKPGRSAVFSSLPGIAADADGNLFLADEGNHRIRKVDPAGTVTTFAGAGAIGPAGGGFNGNERPATRARLNHPYDVETGPRGLVYIADLDNHEVRFVDQAGVIHAAPGKGLGLTWRCGDSGTAPRQAERPRRGEPDLLAADARGNVYLAGDLAPRRLTPSGAITTVAPTAGFPHPAAMAISPGGDLYLLDGARVWFANLSGRRRRVHAITVPPGAVAAVAGTGVPGSTGDGGRAMAARVPDSATLAADTEGNLFIAAGDRARRVDPAGTVTTVAGGGGSTGCCADAAGLALDGSGNLYVGAGVRVWFLNRGSKPVTVHGQTVAAGAIEAVAGNGTSGFEGDRGPALDASLQGAASLAVDKSGNLYISDPGDHTVRRVDPAGTIDTVAGTGTQGFNGDGLRGGFTRLHAPQALAMDRCGNLLVADAGNDRVRRLKLVAPCPATSGPGKPSGLRSVPVLALTAGILAGGAAVVVANRRLRSRRE